MSLRLHLNGLDGWPWAREADDLLRRGVREALEAAGRPAEGELSVTCLPTPAMRELTARWKGREAETDVLAFDLADEDGVALLGDVYVCPDVAVRQARERALPPLQELLRLVVHGVLHLAGHRHPEGSERTESPMFALQEATVRRVWESAEALAPRDEEVR